MGCGGIMDLLSARPALRRALPAARMACPLRPENIHMPGKTVHMIAGITQAGRDLTHLKSQDKRASVTCL